MAKNNTVKDVELGVKIKPVVEDIKNISDLAKILTADSSSIDRRKGKKTLNAIGDYFKTYNDIVSTLDKESSLLFSRVTSSTTKMADTFKKASEFSDENMAKAKGNLTNFAMKEGNLASYIADTVGEGNASISSKVINGFDKLLEDMLIYRDITPEELQKSFDNLTKATEKTIEKDIKIATNRLAIDDKKHKKNLEHIDEVHKKRMEQNVEKHLQSMMFAEEKHQQSIRMNQETHDIARAQRTAWFDQMKQFGLKAALFGYDEVTAKQSAGGLNPQGTTSKHIAGILGQDLKAGILNGIKGSIIGAVMGLLFKALGTIKKVLLSPMEMAKKLATNIFGFLKKALTSAETFKKLIELVMLPFTLLFTLLFAPILAKLAPLLVDMVNIVVSKWDVLEGVGDKIAEILEYFFDDEQWFSFGNILNEFINLLDEISTVALDTFTRLKEEGYDGIGVIASVLAEVFNLITNKLIEFMVSGEFTDLMFNIGRVMGTLIYDGLKILFVSIIPLVVSIGGLFSGVFQTMFKDLISAAVNIFMWELKQALGFWGSWINVDQPDSSTMFSNTSAEISSFMDDYNSNLKYNSDGTVDYITTYNSWTTNNYNSSKVGSGLLQQAVHKGSEYT